MNWKTESGDWTRFRRLPGVVEIDFHRSGEGYNCDYFYAMAGIKDEVLDALKNGQAAGPRYLLFTHGSSTSNGWKQRTTRSVIRGLMRSPAATAYIVRRECIQHYSVFVAAIRTRNESTTEARPGTATETGTISAVRTA